MATARSIAKREYNLARYHERAAWVRGMKTPCIECGYGDVRAIDFHHRDPSTKVADVMTLLRRNASRDRIAAEIAKCDCLCANCHRIFHSP